MNYPPTLCILYIIPPFIYLYTGNNVKIKVTKPPNHHISMCSFITTAYKLPPTLRVLISIMKEQ